jgi:pimeloyl-ACP methyl ester carboxylesterase
MGISLTTSNLYQLLKNSHQKYLVIHGEHDKLTPASKFSQHFSTNPNFTLVSIPKAGHIVTVEKPALVSKAIKNYLFSL